MLGKSPAHALAALEARASRERYEADRAAMLKALDQPAVIEALKMLGAAS